MHRFLFSQRQLTHAHITKHPGESAPHLRDCLGEVVHSQLTDSQQSVSAGYLKATPPASPSRLNRGRTEEGVQTKNPEEASVMNMVTVHV